MTEDADRTKKLINLKRNLEKRVADTESELKELQATLEAVDLILLEKGFRRAEISKEPAKAEAVVAQAQPASESDARHSLPEVESENAMPLETNTGEFLANLYGSENSLRVVLAKDKNFDVNIPPFAQFLIGRVLTKMQERDNELVRAGQLAPDKIFSYNIVREGDLIREVTIKNADAERLKELKSSIRWTLEKMYEKMRSQTS